MRERHQLCKLLCSSGLQMPSAAAHMGILDCGTLMLPRAWRLPRLIDCSIVGRNQADSGGSRLQFLATMMRSQSCGRRCEIACLIADPSGVGLLHSCEPILGPPELEGTVRSSARAIAMIALAIVQVIPSIQTCRRVHAIDTMQTHSTQEHDR